MFTETGRYGPISIGGMVKRNEAEDSLAGYLTADTMLELAGVASYDRGVRYFADGHVERIRLDDRTAGGVVVGMSPYQVKLELDQSALRWSCSCPMGDQGFFCKHAVALGLAAVEAHTADVPLDEDPLSETPPTVSPSAYSVRLDALRAHLNKKSAAELVELAMERAACDPVFEDRLVLEIARADGKRPDIRTFRRVIEEATAIHGFIPYRGSYSFAAGVEEAVNAIGDLLAEGHAAIVIELSEYALSRLEDALGQVDDSDGNLAPIIDTIHDLHIEACRIARPDPESLARRLFEREIGSDWDIFDKAVDQYRDILGERGLAEYRRLAEAEWARVPPLGPGDDDSERYGSRFRITRMMEALATVDGDIDRLVEVMSRDLGHPFCFLAIATVLDKHGDADRALEWAERGAAAFDEPDPRLRLFIADQYHRLGRLDAAVDLMWEAFTKLPDLERYQSLKMYGEQSDTWPQLRDRAISLLRQRENGSELVRLYLVENNVDAAWDEAIERGCANHLWLELARRRAKANPADAIPIFQREVEQTLAQTNKRAYRAAVRLMGEIGDLMRRAEVGEAFADYVADVRSRHRRKTNLMALLDRNP